jgi:hypothetical protein
VWAVGVVMKIARQVPRAAGWGLKAEVNTAAANSGLNSALRMAKPYPKNWAVQRAAS